ncbi:MAG: helix-turn-helix domain-containing protein [Enterococcus lacertideformus]|uniref:Helix-turn-helix domain-containing protein n=1 Tax=Enterococcus lacertideformus TaxID=2771493 RepID=A0A931AYE9_9ENTE|nr:helix-turn-helix domain-containing protein [Enterococcus lacertideformus]
MIEKFLSQSEICRLKILSELIKYESVDIQHLARYASCSVQTVQRNIKVLNEDLKQIDDEIIIKKEANKKYSILLDNKNLLDVYHLLIYQYGQRYGTFLLCEIVIIKAQTLYQLCDTMHFGTTHVYRLIKKTNLILEDTQISLVFNEQGYLMFDGKETDIRAFIYNFILEYIPRNRWILSINKEIVVSKVKKWLTNFCQ